MRKRNHLKYAVSGLLLLSMLLTGCAGERTGNPGSSMADGNGISTQESAAAPADGSWSLESDSAVVAHAEHNDRLKEKKAPRIAEKFALYVENTEGMAGFVPPNSSTGYVESIQAIFDTVNRDYEMSANYLTRTGGAGELTWTNAAMDDGFKYDLLSTKFYENNVLTNPGPLANLFRDGATPFEEDSLTMLVSNFAEPGFNLTPLSKGIELYFDNYEQSAACVIGVSSDFRGDDWYGGADMAIPNNNDKFEGSTFYVKDYNGKAPFYMVIVGPEESVNSFSGTFFKYLDKAGVDYSASLYSNTVYDQIVEIPLEFEMVPDPKAKKATPPVLSSFNTGAAQSSEKGMAFASTYAGVETREGRAPRGAEADENAVSVTTATQISLVSKNFDGTAVYSMDYQLYVFDQASQSWVDAGKNAQEMVHITMEEKDGELKEELGTHECVILASGRREIYLSALLDFSENSALARDKMYRLEIRLHLCRDNPEPVSGINPELDRFSISNAKYYDEIAELCDLTKPNKKWRPSEEDHASASLPYTPNLTSFLLSLENLEGKFRPDNDVVEYVDMIFNVGGNTSKR